MTGAINNVDLINAINQQIKATNDLCGCFQITVNNAVNVGITIEQTAGTEGGTPPEGTGPPDPIADRKCKMAEIIYDDIEQILTNLVNNPLSIGILDIATLHIILFPYLSEDTLWIGLQIGGIWGWLIDIATFIQANFQLLDFSAMLTEWQAKENTIRCTMYNSTTPGEVRADLFGDLALSAPEESWIIDQLLPNDVLNALYFSTGTSESVISAFTPTWDCEPCCPLITTTFGDYNGESPPGFHNWDVSIANNGPLYLLNVRLRFDLGASEYCQACQNLEVTDVNGFTPVDDGPGLEGFRIFGQPFSTTVYTGQTIPPGVQCGAGVLMNSSTAFDVQLHLTGECTCP